MHESGNSVVACDWKETYRHTGTCAHMRKQKQAHQGSRCDGTNEGKVRESMGMRGKWNGRERRGMEENF